MERLEDEIDGWIVPEEMRITYTRRVLSWAHSRTEYKIYKIYSLACMCFTMLDPMYQ